MKNLTEIVLTTIFFACVIVIIIARHDIQMYTAFVACLDFGILLGRISYWYQTKDRLL